MSTEWLKNLEQELENVSGEEIKSAEPEQDFPDKRCIVGEVGQGIRRMMALKKRYCDLNMKYDERYEGFEELKTETSDEGVKLNFEIKRLVTNIEVLDGMIILSILNAFPELSKKHSFTVAKGWKVIGIDAVIVIEGRPRWQHSQN